MPIDRGPFPSSGTRLPALFVSKDGGDEEETYPQGNKESRLVGRKWRERSAGQVREEGDGRLA